MSRQILTIYSSFGIESYGFFIALAVIVTYLLLVRDSLRKQFISESRLSEIFSVMIIVGVLTGRLLFVLTNYNTFSSWFDSFLVWDGGLSLLGSQIGIVLGLAYYCIRSSISFLRLTDLLAFYAPLTISIARIGCFWCGCCFGAPCAFSIAHTYSDPSCLAPLNIPLHPTQLYHSGFLFIIFLLLCTIRARTTQTKTGLITGLSFFLMGMERFIVDFFRGDREFIPFLSYAISIHQLLSLAIAAFSISLLIGIIFHKSRGVNAYE